MTETGVIPEKAENVIIQAGAFSATVLPELGGKIGSIRIGDEELLQAPLAPYGPRTRTMSFDTGDASGWDECLPSVAGCEIVTATGEIVSVPDHGDLWRVAWTEVREQGSGNRDQESDRRSITLRAECFSLPLELQRTMTLTESEQGWQLRLDYTLTNKGAKATPWAWSVHPGFAAESGDRVILPGSITTLTLEGSGGGRLGQNGDLVNWPIATTISGEQTDLSIGHAPETCYGDKLFAGPLTSSENWCVLERPRAGVRIRMRFDAAEMPYLGLWICYGGWPDRAGTKQNCVAIEPTTAPVDSLAIAGPWSRTLAAGASYKWTLFTDFERL